MFWLPCLRHQGPVPHPCAPGSLWSEALMNFSAVTGGPWVVIGPPAAIGFVQCASLLAASASPPFFCRCHPTVSLSLCRLRSLVLLLLCPSLPLRPPHSPNTLSRSSLTPRVRRPTGRRITSSWFCWGTLVWASPPSSCGLYATSSTRTRRQPLGVRAGRRPPLHCFACVCVRGCVRAHGAGCSCVPLPPSLFFGVVVGCRCCGYSCVPGDFPRSHPPPIPSVWP